MRRVCLVTSSLPRWRGDATTPFILELASDLQTLGWEMEIVAPHAPGAKSRETLDGVRIERFRYCWPESAETVCYRGGALVNLRRQPANWLKLPALVASEWRAVARKLRVGRFDLVHAHWILPQGFTSVLAAGRRRVPVVVTVHGGDIFALRGAVLARFKRFALRRAQAVTTNSTAAERAIRDLVGDLPILRRIPMGATNPAPVERAEIDRIRARFARGAPLLCFVGRLIEEKGVDDLLEAIAIAELPGISALIIGDGPHRQNLERKGRALGLEDRVHFLGWMERGEVSRHLAAADIFVGLSKPSRDGWTESQGLTFAEAMLSGLPVIATSVGGVSDSVRDAETGLLVAPSAPREAADAIRRLVLDADLARRLARTGQAYARRFLTRERTAEEFSRLYAELLGEGENRAVTSVSQAEAASADVSAAPRVR